MRPHQKTILAMQAECDQFNASHAVGATVRFWPGVREGRPKEGVIRFAASIMGGHTAVVWVAGAGSIALTHVEGGAA